MDKLEKLLSIISSAVTICGFLGIVAYGTQAGSAGNAHVNQAKHHEIETSVDRGATEQKSNGSQTRGNALPEQQRPIHGFPYRFLINVTACANGIFIFVWMIANVFLIVPIKYYGLDATERCFISLRRVWLFSGGASLLLFLTQQPYFALSTSDKVLAFASVLLWCLSAMGACLVRRSLAEYRKIVSGQ